MRTLTLALLPFLLFAGTCDACPRFSRIFSARQSQPRPIVVAQSVAGCQSYPVTQPHVAPIVQQAAPSVIHHQPSPIAVAPTVQPIIPTFGESCPNGRCPLK